MNRNPPKKKPRKLPNNSLVTPLFDWIAPFVVALVTCISLLPVLWNEFIEWDDSYNLINNLAYRGLGWTELRWMFTTFHAGHYQPLSWVTLGGDYLIWGMNPVGYHLTNLTFHCANAVLFYIVSRHLLAHAMGTRETSRARALHLSAAFAALLFAIHPLRVESVAWATERRDVLSGFFFLWTILCYLRANSDLEVRSSALWRGATFVAYVLSLLSKATAITLPVVLLIIDIYPLRRLQGGAVTWLKSPSRRVLWEKLPFLALATIFAVVALLAQHSTGALRLFYEHSLPARMGQAFYGTFFYLWKSVVPLHLSALYELPYDLEPWWPVYGAAAVACLAVSLTAYFLRLRWPALLACWAYYITMLAPVSGIAQSGLQLVADRYSYLSCLSWALLLAWGVFFGWSRSRRAVNGDRRRLLAIFAVTIPVVLVLAFLTQKQVQTWRDSATLWEHALANAESSIANYNMGYIRETQGRNNESLLLYRRALELDPLYVPAYHNLARLLAQAGKAEEAIVNYNHALEIEPDHAKAHFGLGTLLGLRGNVEGAVQHLQRAVALEADNAEAHANLANVLVMQGDLKSAVQHYRKALEITPTLDQTRLSLASAFLQLNEFDTAAEELQLLVKKRPDFAEARFLLGNALAARRHLDEAIEEFRETVRLKPSFSDGHIALARALVSSGQADEAAQHYRQALMLLKARRDAAK